MKFLNKQFNPVDVFTNKVDVYKTLTVVEEKKDAVKFNNGTSARVVAGKIINHKQA